MWKKIGIGIALLLILMAGAGYYLFSNLDGFIKSAIETYGAQVTQTAVEVGGVNLSLTSGSGAISALTIANPPGYTAAQAFAVGNIAVQLDTSTLAGSLPVTIDRIAITQPQVTYEVKGLGQGSNLQTIERNIEAYGSSGQAQAQAQSNSGAARKLIIRDLTISGGEVYVVAPLLNKTLREPLPALHLTDLGGSSGATPAALGAEVITDLSRQAVIAGAAALARDQLGAGSTLLKGNTGSALKTLFGG